MPSRLIFIGLTAGLLGGCNSLSTRQEYGIYCSSIKADVSWGAISGLAADQTDPHTLYGVHDHNLPDQEIYVLKLSSRPVVVITRIIPVRKNGQMPDYDLEGITRREQGGFWLASEGKPGRRLPNLIVRVDDRGQVLEEIPLPARLSPYRTKAGFEGVTVDGAGADERVTVVFQRRWKDDPKGMLKIGRYRVHDRQWQFFHYPLDANKGVGLSSIEALGNDRYLVLERDNRPFFKARIKRIYAVTLPTQDGRQERIPKLGKQLVHDLLASHNALSCGTDGKLEGMALTNSGLLYLIADDDGKGNARLLRLAR